MANTNASMKPWQKRTLITVFILLTLFTALWNLVPFAAKWFINRTIEPFNSTFQADTINPNIFPIGLQLSDITVTQASIERLHLGNASVGLDFIPLFKGEFHINHLTLTDFHTQVSSSQTGISIAGIPLPQNDQPEAPAPTTESSNTPPSSAPALPTVYLNTAALQDISVDYQTSKGSDKLYIKSADISEAYHKGAEWAGRLSVTAGINEAKLELLGQISAKSREIDADMNLRSLALNTKDIKHFFPAKLSSNLSSNIYVEGQTNIQYHFGDDPTLQVSSPLLQVKSGETELKQGDQKVAWSDLTATLSDISIKQLGQSIASASMTAKVTSKDLALQSSDQAINTESLTFESSIMLDKNDSSIAAHDSHGALSLSNLTGQLNGNSFSSAAFKSSLDDINAELDSNTMAGDIQASLNIDAQSVMAKTSNDEKVTLSSIALDAPLSIKTNGTQNDIQSQALTLDLNQLALSAPQGNAALASLGLQLQDSTVSVLSDNTSFTSKVTLSSDQLSANTAATESSASHSFAFQSLKFNSDIAGEANQQSIALQSQKTLFTVKEPTFESSKENASLALFSWSAEDLNARLSGEELSFSTKSKLELRSLNASASNLPNKQPPTSIAMQSLQLNNDVEVTQSPSKLDLASSDNTIKLQAAKVDQQDTLTTSLDQLDFGNAQVTLSLNNGQLNRLSATKNNITMGPLSAELEDGSTLVNFDKFAMNSSSIAQNNDGISADIETISLNQFIASKPKVEADLPAIAMFDSLDANRIALRPEGVDVSSVVFQNLDAGLVLTSNQKIDNLVLPNTIDSEIDGRSNQQTTDTTPLNDQELNQELEKAFYVVIDKINISEGSSIDFTDRSIVPTLNRVLTIKELTVDNLNTRDQGAKTHLTLKAQNGRYATIDSDVTIEPLAEKLTMDATATVREVELPPVSPYISSALGYNIASGQLNMDLAVAAQQGELTGNSHIVLRQFDLGGKQESNTILKVGAVPLNLAVNALKDGNDNIILDLPMKGNIDSPQFQWQNFFMLPIRQGLYKASSVYLMQTFVPYANVISLAQLAGEQVLKVRIQPLEFAYGQTQVDDTQEAYLAQLLALMKDREDSEVRACGVAVAKDLYESMTDAELNDEQRTQLYRLANQRADSLKGYLVDNDIESGRIFICTPEVDNQADAKPRVELNF